VVLSALGRLAMEYPSVLELRHEQRGVEAGAGGSMKESIVSISKTRAVTAPSPCSQTQQDERTVHAWDGRNLASSARGRLLYVGIRGRLLRGGDS
jgi:hypothetical protein